MLDATLLHKDFAKRGVFQVVALAAAWAVVSVTVVICLGRDGLEFVSGMFGAIVVFAGYTHGLKKKDIAHIEKLATEPKGEET